MIFSLFPCLSQQTPLAISRRATSVKALRRGLKHNERGSPLRRYHRHYRRWFRRGPAYEVYYYADGSAVVLYVDTDPHGNIRVRLQTFGYTSKRPHNYARGC